MDRKEAPHPVDLHVGKRVQMRRKLAGLSQEQLAAELGLTFQQIQKYESGANRISASRLWEIARIFQVPIQYFFDEMGGLDTTHGFIGFAESGQVPLEGIPSVAKADDEMLQRRETLEFLRSYHSIDTAQRRTVYELVKGMAKGRS